jgi:hypothetical protein
VVRDGTKVKVEVKVDLVSIGPLRMSLRAFFVVLTLRFLAVLTFS